MMGWLSRTEQLLGRGAVEKLQKSHVAVFGLGGVGGYACEALARSGIGAFDLIDHDTVSITNLNRQIIATRRSIGRLKTEVMKERILDINPEAKVCIHNCFFLPENADDFDFTKYDYIIDAVDTVTAKLALVAEAKRNGVLIISSMGAGNKLDGSRFCVADIYDTKVCPLAKVMRRELKKRNIEELKVVYSEEPPIFTESLAENEDVDFCKRKNEKRNPPGSIAFVPSVAGLVMAGEVVKDLVNV